MECYPRLRERGQVTIPEDVRIALDAEPGDQLRLHVEELRSDAADSDQDACAGADED